MLFWLFVIIAVVFGLIAWIAFDNDWIEVVLPVSVSISGLSVVAILISLLIMMFSYIGNDGYVARLNHRYDMLVYQYENDFYENDNDIGKRELIEDIKDWNELLAGKKIDQTDFWIGIYVPNIYDQFEFISLEQGE
jgi:uncharacterized membrane protein (DUF485 family)